MAYEYEMTLDRALNIIVVDSIDNEWEEQMMKLNDDLREFASLVDDGDEAVIDASDEAWWIKE